MLNLIQNHVIKYAEVISNVVGVDVAIVDKNMLRIAGTGLYKNKKQLFSKGLVFKDTLRTGKTRVIENPREHDLCLKCKSKDECREILEISEPIFCKDEIVGVIGLVCFNEKQKIKILENINYFLKFTEQISELIGIKLYEYRDKESQIEKKLLLEGVLENIDKGVIIFSKSKEVENLNEYAKQKLNIPKSKEFSGIKIKIVKKRDFLHEESVYEMKFNDEVKSVVGKYIPLSNDNYNSKNMFIFEDLEAKNEMLNTSNIYSSIEMDDIIGESNFIIELKNKIKKISKSDSTVLITGESGTGKELVARGIHTNSNRKDKQFVAINCAAIPDSLIESELFGYIKGAFTGANSNGKIGKFELANGGTIFLDEIGDLPFYLQGKLLRVIQERTITRIGDNENIDLDIRIVAATNVDLEKKIEEKKFRRDLFYRLNVVPIKLEPLRERKEDVRVLVDFLIKKYNQKNNKYVHTLSDKTLDKLVNYSWPGNVRELENTVELLINLSDDRGEITFDMLPKNIVNNEGELVYLQESGLKKLEEIEKEYIFKVLEKFGKTTEGKKKAAKVLGIGLTTLYRKLELSK